MTYKTYFLLVLLLHLLNVSAAQADETETVIVPESISDAYSDIDMRMRLAAKPNAAPCAAESCNFNQAFDARVQQLGAKLSASAFVLYPTLKKRVAQFSFSVVDKKDLGAASNGAGKVVLFRGLQTLPLDDDALSFILAREMGHVIGKHHHKNASTKLIISALATILFPAVGIIGASSTATQATTLFTSAATTATSMLGSEVAMSRMKPNQLLESDEIAINLMNQQDWDLRTTVNILQMEDDADAATAKNSWMQDLQVSNANLQKIVDNEDAGVAELEDADLMANLSKAAQDLPMDEIAEKIAEDAEIEPAAEVDADVVVEALH